MIGILFLVLAIIIVYLSTKISEYSDKLSKKSKIGSLLIGGLFLAGITSLPELVTCISSIYMKNPYLSFGDVLGSNVFNIFFICIFDIIFFKFLIFNKTSNHYWYVLLMLITNYISIYLSIIGYVDFKILGLGFPSIIILILYIIYILIISKSKEKIQESIQDNDKHLWKRFIICAFFLIISSILLTVVVNKISLANPKFSGSFIGAIMLGTVTSLPEVVTFFSLIKLKSYDLAISDIIGSNLFNLLVLVIGDFVIAKGTIYHYTDYESITLLQLALLTTIINLYQNSRKTKTNKIIYVLPSLIIISLYVVFLIKRFV